MSRHHRQLSLVLLALIGACAPARQYDALSPIGARVTNEVLSEDAQTLALWEHRLAAIQPADGRALPSRAYTHARARAWLAYAREAYARDPRDGAADAALARTRQLIHALETDSLPADAMTSLSADLRTRPDLWATLDTVRGGPAVHDAPVVLADAELALVRAGYLSHRAPGVAPLAQLASDNQSACEARTQETRAAMLLTSLRPNQSTSLSVSLAGEPVSVRHSFGMTSHARPVDSRVHFALGSSVLAPSSRSTLADVVAVLRAHKGVNVIIEGYTDSRGRLAGNRELAIRRADAVRRFLSDAQLPLGRVLIAGIGPDSDAVRHVSTEAFARDRRATLVFSDSNGEPLGKAKDELHDLDRETDLQIEQQHRSHTRNARHKPSKPAVSRLTPR